MKLRVGLMMFCAYVCVGASDRDREGMKVLVHPGYGTLGFGLEMVLTKFDFIVKKLHNVEVKLQNIEDKLQMTDGKLKKIENEVKEHRSEQRQIAAALNELRSSQHQSQKEIFAELQKLKNHVALNISELQNRNQEKVDAVLHKLDQDVGRVLQKQDTQQPFSSCKDIPTDVSGTYLIGLNNAGIKVPLRVYCEQNAFGGGWIVMQYRYDASLDFHRGWSEFRDGFGDFRKEFWLGLEKVHQITKRRGHELIVELKDFNGTYTYARYDAFEIESEILGYVLNRLGSYSGTAVDGMRLIRNENISTKDRDNDNRQCAYQIEGTWWHWGGNDMDSCNWANLNDELMFWHFFKNNHQRFKYTRMMIRELE